MTRHLFAAPFAGFTILSPKRPYVPTMVQVRIPSVWHASSLNETLTTAPQASQPTKNRAVFINMSRLGSDLRPLRRVTTNDMRA